MHTDFVRLKSLIYGVHYWKLVCCYEFGRLSVMTLGLFAVAVNVIKWDQRIWNDPHCIFPVLSVLALLALSVVAAFGLEFRISYPNLYELETSPPVEFSTLIESESDLSHAF